MCVCEVAMQKDNFDSLNIINIRQINIVSSKLS